MWQVPYDWIAPDWPASPQVRACTTTRSGGHSAAPYDSMNLGDHVEDDPALISANRATLVEALALPSEPLWLSQVHGVAVVDAASAEPGTAADGSFSTQSGVVCAVMTADCLPVLFCDSKGQWVAAAHAGWRGLLHGVLEATLEQSPVPRGQLMAWMGPAIGPDAFEVGAEVRDAFTAHDADAAAAFQPSPQGRWLADIYQLARQRLQRAGVNAVYGGGFCTYSDAARFYSYRRDNVTGRMASLIWLQP